MKKIRIIIGKADSGKTMVAKAMTIMFKEGEIVKLPPGSINSTWVYSQCDKNTKVIVIDDLKKIDDVIGLVYSSFSGIEVNAPCKEPFKIHPYLIIVCRDNIKKDELLKLGASISRRIEIIETLSN